MLNIEKVNPAHSLQGGLKTHHPSLTLSPGPWAKGSAGKGRGGQGPQCGWSWESGLMFERGNIFQKSSVAQGEEVSPKPGQTKLPVWTHFIRGLRQPGSEVPASAFSLSHTEKEAVNTQMQGLTLHVVSGTL